MDLDYINELVDVKKYYLYYNNKPILSATTMKTLASEIKTNIEAPKKKIKVFVVNFKKTTNNKKLFIIGCYKFTITPKLVLISDDDDLGQNITYSKLELEKRKFRLSDIKKIIKLINDENTSDETSMPITQLIKLTA